MIESNIHPFLNRAICSINDIDIGSAKSFIFESKIKNIEIFLICILDKGHSPKSGEKLFFAYENICPHQFIPLNLKPNTFLDTSKKSIQCSSHGAKFDITNGYCFSGPCVGKYLNFINTFINKGIIYFG